MQRIVAAGCQHAVDVHQILHAGDLGAENDAIMPETRRLGKRGGLEGTLYHCFEDHETHVLRNRAARVGIHHCGQQVLVQRSPIHPDPYRFVVEQRNFDDRPEIFIAPFASDIPRIDPILGECPGAIGMPAEELVPVIVKVADERDRHTIFLQGIPNVRHSRRGRFIVDGHPDQLTAGACQRRDLLHGGHHICRVGVGHGLYHNRRTRPDRDAPDEGGDRTPAHDGRHG
jgi:hypothetical protein